MMKVFALALFAILASCSASPFDPTKPYLPWKRGSCLKNVGLTDFKAGEFFNGKWFELSSFGNYLLQADGTCSTWESEVKGTQVRTLYYQYEPLLKKYVYFRSATDLSKLAGSSFNLQYDMFAGLYTVNIPFTVVGTDYDHYAVLYSCQEAFGFKAEASWILTREAGKLDEAKTQLEADLTKAGLKEADYIPQVITNCGPNPPTL